MSYGHVNRHTDKNRPAFPSSKKVSAARKTSKVPRPGGLAHNEFFGDDVLYKLTFYIHTNY